MKKIFCIAMPAILLLAFAACGTAPIMKDTLTGTPEEVLTQVMEASRADLAMTIGSDITAKSAQRALGLTGTQFIEFVDCAYEAAPVLTTIAQGNAIVKCKSAVAAVKVKNLIATGYDCDQWAGAVPEKAVVVESGSYVLLAVGATEATDAFVRAFKSVSGGNTGEPDLFFPGIMN